MLRLSTPPIKQAFFADGDANESLHGSQWNVYTWSMPLLGSRFIGNSANGSRLSFAFFSLSSNNWIYLRAPQVKWKALFSFFLKITFDFSKDFF